MKKNMEMWNLYKIPPRYVSHSRLPYIAFFTYMTHPVMPSAPLVTFDFRIWSTQ